MADDREGKGLPADSSVAAGPPASGAAHAEREEFLLRMGERYDEMMARAGAEGQSIDEIEGLALELGRQASQELMAKRLGAEEQRGRRPRVCPRCGHPLRWASKAQERHLETSAGLVRYERRHAFCDRCRDSFSPGGREADDPAAGRIEPSGQKDM